MRVRLFSPGPPVEVPAAPAIKPAVKQPGREQPEQSVAAVPPPLPAPTPQAPETTAAAVSTVAQMSGLAPVPEVTARGESPERQASEEAAPTRVATALSPGLPPSAVQTLLATEAGGSATGSADSLPAPAIAGIGSGGPAAAGTEREGYEAPGAAVADAGAASAAAAVATAAHPGPGLRDLAVVRHRIDAHKVYPPIAVRNGWEGRVLVEMRLEGDGSLTTVRLLEGSGYGVLDDATIVAVRRASPFPPVARVLTVPVEYRLVP